MYYKNQIVHQCDEQSGFVICNLFLGVLTL